MAGDKSNKRLRVLQIFFIVFAVVIIGRALLIQLQPHPKLVSLAQRQFSSKLTALPRRGLIFDRNGEGLAISLKVHSLFIRPKDLKAELSQKERSRILFNLAKIFKLPLAQLQAKFNSGKSFVWIKRQLTQEEEDSLHSRGVLASSDAVGLVEETKRFYPNLSLASHVLGAVNVDGDGLEGLEHYYNAILKGEQVRVQSTKDAMGRRIFKDEQGLLAFKDGQSLVLTIDKTLQYDAEKILRAAIEEYSAKEGTVIVAEVKSGEILAMANYPTFNANNSKAATMDARRNRAITDAYEPGSTFKPYVLGLALENGKSLKSSVYCEQGSFKVSGHKISEAEAHEKFEWLTLSEMIQHSSNVGAAKLALELGPKKIGELATRLGLGKKTGIDLPGEASGSFDKKELNSKIRLANVGFGHGFMVTPLQMLSLYLALANNGQWIQPRLLKATLSEDPEALQSGEFKWKQAANSTEKITRELFKSQITTQITKALKGVTEAPGTGVQAQLEEWPVAGKTGTSQKVDPNTHKYSKQQFIASFAGFAPAKNPELVSIVIINEPRKKYYAGETAAPTFQKIMRAGLMKLKVAPTDAKARTLQLANRSLIQSLENTPEEKPETEEGAVPDYIGLSLPEILKQAQGKPYEFEVIGSGVLKEQTPKPNTKLNPALESRVKIKLFFDTP